MNNYYSKLLFTLGFFLSFSCFSYSQIKVDSNSDVFVRDVNSVYEKGAFNVGLNETWQTTGLHQIGVGLFLKPSFEMDKFTGLYTDASFSASAPASSGLFKTRKVIENYTNCNAHVWFTGFSNEVSQSKIAGAEMGNYIGFLNRISQAHSFIEGYKNDIHDPNFGGSAMGKNIFSDDIYAFSNYLANNPDITTGTKRLVGLRNEILVGGGGTMHYIVGTLNHLNKQANTSDFKGVLYGTSSNIPPNTGSGLKYGIYSNVQDINGQQYAGFFVGKGVYTGSWIQGSDEKLKENIEELKSGLEFIMKVKPKSYNFINDKRELANGRKRVHYGFLAQEALEVLPDLVDDIHIPGEIVSKNEVVEVYETIRSVDSNGNVQSEVKPVKTNRTISVHEPGEDYLGVNYIELVPILIRAIQEQQEQIEGLQKQIDALK